MYAGLLLPIFDLCLVRMATSSAPADTTTKVAVLGDDETYAETSQPVVASSLSAPHTPPPPQLPGRASSHADSVSVSTVLHTGLGDWYWWWN